MLDLLFCRGHNFRSATSTPRTTQALYRALCLERERTRWVSKRARQGKKQGVSDARHAFASETTMFLTERGRRKSTQSGQALLDLRLLTKYVFKSAIVKTNKLRVFQASLVQREVPRNEAEGL